MASVDAPKKTVKKSDPFEIEKALPGLPKVGGMLKPKITQAKAFGAGALGQGGAKSRVAAPGAFAAGAKTGDRAFKAATGKPGVAVASGAAGFAGGSMMNRPKQQVRKSDPFGVSKSSERAAFSIVRPAGKLLKSKKTTYKFPEGGGKAEVIGREGGGLTRGAKVGAGAAGAAAAGGAGYVASRKKSVKKSQPNPFGVDHG